MNMKVLWILLAVTMLETEQSQAQGRREKIVPPGLEAQVKQLFTLKKAQARALAKEEKQEQVPEIWEFFTAGENGDWQTVNSLYRNLRRGAYQYEGGRKDARLETMVWQPVNECYGACEQSWDGEEKYVTMFAREILDSLPRGSIYFGGTDPGRWLPTAFSKSHPKADPCYVLTQNALADGLYLKYLRTMYGDHITMPTDKDSQKAFKDYMDDAQKRLKEGKLKPGENVTEVDGKVQLSGQVAVMAINALIAKKIFEANPRKEFFIEESFPLDWMYPYLSPHGLIMKLNREPLKEMTTDAVRKDQEYWMRFTDGALGKWLRPTTSVDEVCAFAEKVFELKDLSDFNGDAKFVENASACKTYSKLRSSTAGVYAWRAKNGSSADEKKRMTSAADFAFRQALALCPYSPEAVFRYVNLLTEQKRIPEAILVVDTAQRLDPGNGSLGNLFLELEKMK